MGVGDRIQEAISVSGYKLSTVARGVGVHPTTVGRWIRGESTPGAEHLRALGEFFGRDFLAEDDSAEDEPRVFVSSPISAFDPERFPDAHAKVARVVAAIREVVRHVEWPGEQVDGKHPLAAEIVTEPNMIALERSNVFVFVQLDEVTRGSGALVEVGIALGLKRSTTLFLIKDVRRPFMFAQGFGKVAAQVPFLPNVHMIDVGSVEEVETIVRTSGRQLFRPQKDDEYRDAARGSMKRTTRSH